MCACVCDGIECSRESVIITSYSIRSVFSRSSSRAATLPKHERCTNEKVSQHTSFIRNEKCIDSRNPFSFSVQFPSAPFGPHSLYNLSIINFTASNAQSPMQCHAIRTGGGRCASRASRPWPRSAPPQLSGTYAGGVCVCVCVCE